MNKQLPKSDPPSGKKSTLPQLLVQGGILGAILWFIEFFFLCRFYNINSLLWHHRIEIIIANILGTGSAYFIAGVLITLIIWIVAYRYPGKKSGHSKIIFTILASCILSSANILYLRFWLFGHLRITYHKVYFYLNLAFIIIDLVLSIIIFIGVNFFSPKRDRRSFYAALTVFLGYCFIFGSHNNLMFYRFRKATGLPRFSWEVLAVNTAFLLAALAIGLFSWLLFRKYIPRLNRLKSRTTWLILSSFFLVSIIFNGIFRHDWAKYLVKNPSIQSRYSMQEKQMPDIIFIVMDALRADHLGCYGYPRNTTPFIDSLAERGVLFENYNSSSNFTFPFLNTFLSGNGYRKYFFQEHIKNPPVHLPLIPELLRPAGYRSAAFIPLELAERKDPGFTFLRRFGIGGELPKSALQDMIFNNAFKQAFDAYSTSLTFSRKFWIYKLVERFFSFRTPMYMVRFDRFDTFCRRAIAWIEEEPETPLFVYLHPRGAHHPYFPPPDADHRFFPGTFPEDIERANSLYSLSIVLKKRPSDQLVSQVLDLYDDVIAYLDTTMEWFWEELNKKGLLDNTLIIISADHGESFYEHGTGLHHSSLYQEETHVPMIILWGDRISHGLRLKGSFSALDVCPTLLEAAGLTIPEDLPGSSFLEYLNGLKNPPEEQTSFSEDAWKGWTDMLSVQRFPWKVIAHISNGKIAETEVYNLSEDPGEKQNLAAGEIGQPEVSGMIEKIRSYIEKYPLSGPPLNNEQALEALGYGGKKISETPGKNQSE